MIVGVYVGIFVVIPSLISWILNTIKEKRDVKRSEQRNEIAMDVIAEYGLTSSNNEVLENSFEYVVGTLQNRVVEAQPYEITAQRSIYKIPEEICTKCGVGHLVQRQGPYGYFLGCSNYPRCTFTKQITFSKTSSKNTQKKLIAKEFLKDLEKAYS